MQRVEIGPAKCIQCCRRILYEEEHTRGHESHEDSGYAAVYAAGAGLSFTCVGNGARCHCVESLTIVPAGPRTCSYNDCKTGWRNDLDIRSLLAINVVLVCLMH